MWTGTNRTLIETNIYCGFVDTYQRDVEKKVNIIWKADFTSIFPLFSCHWFTIEVWFRFFSSRICLSACDQRVQFLQCLSSLQPNNGPVCQSSKNLSGLFLLALVALQWPRFLSSRCTVLWEGVCSVLSWVISSWWSPLRRTTGCSTASLETMPTRVCGATACPTSATCRRTA